MDIHLNGTSLEELPNGKRREILYKIKESFRLLFSSELWDEVIEEEEQKARSARDAAAKKQYNGQQQEC